MFKPVSSNVDFVRLENEILAYWQKNNIVEKYLKKNDKSKKLFSFLDGPITANNPMGIHHAWGRTYKDLWQRFFNMMGYKQRFQNGFDCQGLWVEVEVEKELGIKNKRDIENLVPGNKKASIAKFVELCKERVRKFSTIQTEQSQRLGYFMDWDNSYFTMSDENNYMIWHFLKTCHQKGWIYKGLDSVPWCPRCETAISQHEMLTEDYKELTHETIFVKFPISNFQIQIKVKNLYLLIWTTTPWTVPANVAVGVNTKFTYSIWENDKLNEALILLDRDDQNNVPIRMLKGKEVPLCEYVFSESMADYKKVKEVKGSELVGLKFEAPFDHLPKVMQAKRENPTTFHTVVEANEIVVASEGTGLLHVAPGAGKEDFNLGKKKKLSVISVIGDDASYLNGLKDFSGKNAKKHPEIIIDFLKTYEGGRYLLKTMKFTHRYPACWRCKTELVWKVTNEWYIAMDKKGNQPKTLREQMIEVAKKIDWHPQFGLERELDWLSNMQDWLISKKNRYWGLALPIFECTKCGNFEVIEGKAELKTKAVEGWAKFEGHSPHKPYIDEISIKCASCGKKTPRIDDVGNVWLDAGIVPFSTYIDPQTKKLSYTTDRKFWQKWFPPDFITESFPGQFKNWFYSMIAMATVLEKTNPFKTVLGFASVLGEDGRPMHKSWGNAIDFNEGALKIGVDVARWMYATQNPTENLLFGYKKADETRRRFHLKLWNIYNFFVTYAAVDNWEKTEITKIDTTDILDRWILAYINKLVSEVTLSLQKYDAYSAANKIDIFVDDLSVWYVRRIRDRVGPTVENSADKDQAFDTLSKVLDLLTRLLAPFLPFISEEINKNITGCESVHLSDWPKIEKVTGQDEMIFEKMNKVRQIVELGHAARKKEGIKVRQPLQNIKIKNLKIILERDYIKLIKDELNIKNLEIEEGKGELVIVLDTKITAELKDEGWARDLVRQIQNKRKEAKCGLSDKIKVFLPKWPHQYEDYIKSQTLSHSLNTGPVLAIEKT